MQAGKEEVLTSLVHVPHTRRLLLVTGSTAKLVRRFAKPFKKYGWRLRGDVAFSSTTREFYIWIEKIEEGRSLDLTFSGFHTR
jgi:hypothetical protein